MLENLRKEGWSEEYDKLRVCLLLQTPVQFLFFRNISQGAENSGNERIFYPIRWWGDVHLYFHFSEHEYQQFLRAESKIWHFLGNIRNCFSYERMTKLQVA